MTKSARAPHGQAQVLQRKDTELPAFDCLVKVGELDQLPCVGARAGARRIGRGEAGGHERRGSCRVISNETYWDAHLNLVGITYI